MSELQDKINVHLQRPLDKPIEIDKREANIVRFYEECMKKGWMTVNSAFDAAVANLEGLRWTPPCSPRSIKF